MLSYEKLKAMDAEYAGSRKGVEPEELTLALCARYPFLVPRNRHTDEVIKFTNEHYYENRFSKPDSEYMLDAGRDVGGWTELHDLDWGWRKAFGIDICEDIRTVLLAIGGQRALEGYRILQIKEKFGGMRWYTTFHADDLPKSKPRVEVIGGPSLRTGSGLPGESWRWLSCVEEFYCSIAEHVCIICGGVEDVKRTKPWIMPVCPCCRRWSEPESKLLPRPKKDEPFCVWTHGSEGNVSYKDMIVGSDAPIVKALELSAPLHATEIWERVAI